MINENTRSEREVRFLQSGDCYPGYTFSRRGLLHDAEVAYSRAGYMLQEQTNMHVRYAIGKKEPFTNISLLKTGLECARFFAQTDLHYTPEEFMKANEEYASFLHEFLVILEKSSVHLRNNATDLRSKESRENLGAYIHQILATESVQLDIEKWLQEAHMYRGISVKSLSKVQRDRCSPSCLQQTQAIQDGLYLPGESIVFAKGKVRNVTHQISLIVPNDAIETVLQFDEVVQQDSFTQSEDYPAGILSPQALQQNNPINYSELMVVDPTFFQFFLNGFRKDEQVLGSLPISQSIEMMKKYLPNCFTEEGVFIGSAHEYMLALAYAGVPGAFFAIPEAEKRQLFNLIAPVEVYATVVA